MSVHLCSCFGWLRFVLPLPPAKACLAELGRLSRTLPSQPRLAWLWLLVPCQGLPGLGGLGLPGQPLQMANLLEGKLARTPAVCSIGWQTRPKDVRVRSACRSRYRNSCHSPDGTLIPFTCWRVMYRNSAARSPRTPASSVGTSMTIVCGLESPLPALSWA